jgi:hypothetical protein
MNKPLPTELERELFDHLDVATHFLIGGNRPDESDQARLDVLAKYRAKYGDNSTSAEPTSAAVPFFAGLQVPGGEERIAAAIKTFDDASAEVANRAGHFIEQFAPLFVEIKADDSEELRDDLVELQGLISTRVDAQEELLRAIGGRKAVEL